MRYSLLFRLTSIFLLMGAGITRATIYYPAGLDAATVRSNANLEVAYDVHEVLAKPTGRFFHYAGNASMLLKSGLKYVFFGKNGGVRRATDEIHALPKGASGEAAYHILKKHGESSLAHFVKTQACSYKPMRGMQEIVRQVDERGITQRIASNIGPRMFDELQDRFESKYGNTLFSYLDNGMMVDYSQYGKRKYRLPILPVYLCRHPKPHSSFFAAYKASYNPYGRRCIVFVDDRLENIQAAVCAGWVGVHVPHKKSKQVVKMIRKDFRELGILP